MHQDLNLLPAIGLVQSIPKREDQAKIIFLAKGKKTCQKRYLPSEKMLPKNIFVVNNKKILIEHA